MYGEVTLRARSIDPGPETCITIMQKRIGVKEFQLLYWRDSGAMLLVLDHSIGRRVHRMTVLHDIQKYLQKHLCMDDYLKCEAEIFKLI